MKFFATAKHWQLFLLMFVLPFVIVMFVTVGMIVGMVTEIEALERSPQSPADFAFFGRLGYIYLIVLPLTWISFLWQWNLGKFLQKACPEQFRMKSTLFKVCVISTVLFGNLVMLASFMLFQSIGNGMDNPDEISMRIFALMIPLMLFGFLIAAAGIYILYFLAKSLKTAELQKEVTFGDYVAEFFLFWFFQLIGVFFIQPTINKLAEKYYTNGGTIED